MEDKRTRTVKTVLEKKKNKFKELTLSDFRTYYKATVIKKVWYWQRQRSTDQWNRIQCLETGPHIYGQLTFDKVQR